MYLVPARTGRYGGTVSAQQCVAFVATINKGACIARVGIVCTRYSSSTAARLGADVGTNRNRDVLLCHQLPLETTLLTMLYGGRDGVYVHQCIYARNTSSPRVRTSTRGRSRFEATTAVLL